MKQMVLKEIQYCMMYAGNPRIVIRRARLSALAVRIISRDTSTTPTPKYEKEMMTTKTLALAQSITSNGGDEKSILSRRRALSKAITLIESSSYDHMQQGDLLLNYLIGANGKAKEQHNEDNKQSKNSFRIGIAGAPGAGKYYKK